MEKNSINYQITFVELTPISLCAYMTNNSV